MRFTTRAITWSLQETVIVGAALEPKLTLTCQKDGSFPPDSQWEKCAKYVIELKVFVLLLNWQFSHRPLTYFRRINEVGVNYFCQGYHESKSLLNPKPQYIENPWLHFLPYEHVLNMPKWTPGTFEPFYTSSPFSSQGTARYLRPRPATRPPPRSRPPRWTRRSPTCAPGSTRRWRAPATTRTPSSAAATPTSPRAGLCARYVYYRVSQG